MQIRGQPVQRPRRKGQAQCPWRRERGGDHGRDLLGRIGGGPSGASAVFEPVQALDIDAVDPAADGLDLGADELGDARGAEALAGVVDDARAFDLTREGPVAKFASKPRNGRIGSAFKLGCPRMAVVKCRPARPISQPFSNFATGPHRLRAPDTPARLPEARVMLNA